LNLGRNILSNYLGAAASALVPIVAIPVLLARMGDVAWGYASLTMTIVGALALVDAGLGQALIRSFAIRNPASSSENRALALLKSLERVYLGLTAVIAVAATVAAPRLSAWLQHGDSGHSGEVSLSVLGAIVIFALTLPASVYRSALLGVGLHVQLNLLTTSFLVVRYVGAVVAAGTPDGLTAFISWFAIIAAVELVARRALARRLISGINNEQVSVHSEAQTIGHELRDAAVLSIAVIFSSAAIYLDRMQAAKHLTIKDFGAAAIALSLGYGVLSLTNPLIVSLLPHYVQQREDVKKTRRFNLQLVASFLAAIMLASVAYLLVSRQVIHWWLGNPIISDGVHRALAVVLLGSACNALYNVIYLNWLAAGTATPILAINLIHFALAATVTPLALTRFGLAGLGLTWLAYNGVALVLGTLWNLRARFLELPKAS
jgi:O-antigen/teichoic acid export membrane protein